MKIVFGGRGTTVYADIADVPKINAEKLEQLIYASFKHNRATVILEWKMLKVVESFPQTRTPSRTCTWKEFVTIADGALPHLRRLEGDFRE